MTWKSDYNKFGANRTPVMQGLSSTDNTTPIPVAVDPATGEILTSSRGGGSTQYTNGQAVTTPTGTVSLGYDGANVRALNTDTSGNLYTISTGSVTQSGTWNVGLNAGTNNIGNVGTVLGSVNVGQTTSSTSAVQLSSTSTVPVNGILVQAISTNTASVFIGGSGVTTSTGFELQEGQAVPFTCNNITDLYVVGSNTSDKVCWNVM